MTYIKIGETLYPSTIDGRIVDRDWDNRESKTINLEMSYTEAESLFVDGLAWSIVEQFEVPVYQDNENGEPVQTGTEIQEVEYDNGEFCVAGDITDHRDGTLSIKMGKLTDLEEAYEMLLGGAE